MNVIELLFMGGVEFMSILSLCLIGVIVLGIFLFKHPMSVNQQPYWLRQGVRQIGLFALFFGLLGQIIGLMTAFRAIEMTGEVSQSIMAGGLYVSSITTAFGFIIFLLSIVIDFIVKSIK
jgi:hypothetical protein